MHLEANAENNNEPLAARRRLEWFESFERERTMRRLRSRIWDNSSSNISERERERKRNGKFPAAFSIKKKQVSIKRKIGRRTAKAWGNAKNPNLVSYDIMWYYPQWLWHSQLAAFQFFTFRQQQTNMHGDFYDLTDTCRAILRVQTVWYLASSSRPG